MKIVIHLSILPFFKRNMIASVTRGEKQPGNYPVSHFNRASVNIPICSVTSSPWQPSVPLSQHCHHRLPHLPVVSGYGQGPGPVKVSIIS